MKIYEIQAEPREGTGKKVANKLRKQGMVPCVIYGGSETTHFSTSEKELQKLIFTNQIYKIQITIGEKKIMTLLKDIQFHPVTDRILHIDFLEVFPGKPVVVEIPVKLEGFAAGVKEGGKLHLNSRKLRAKAMIDDIIDLFIVNVENLTLGHTIFVGDLSFDKITLLDPPNRAVASVKLTRIVKEEEEAVPVEGEEGAEGAEGAEGKEGAAKEGAAKEGAAKEGAEKGKEKGKGKGKEKE